MGRNPYWFLQAGAASVLGVDVDDGTLATARKNLASFPNARVEKRSAHDLDPSVEGTFDRVTCIGVLHHLADYENALRKMWGCVQHGGDLVAVVLREGRQSRAAPDHSSPFRAIGSRAPIGCHTR
jgi:2-polyprenyl-3-methyl-5-hydroxy-6-metoxy-1,4-benzoquinol methylase